MLIFSIFIFRKFYMKKSIKSLNCKFFKNIVLSSSLGFCVACGNDLEKYNLNDVEYLKVNEVENLEKLGNFSSKRAVNLADNDWLNVCFHNDLYVDKDHFVFKFIPKYKMVYLVFFDV